MTAKSFHILMLIDAWFPFVGGGQTHVQHLSHHLATNHHCHITIIYPHSHSTHSRFIWSLTIIPQLISTIRTQSIDIIHSHGFIPGLPARIASLLTRIPVIHTIHGSHLMDLHLTTPKTFFEKFLLTHIPYTAQITVSRSFLNYSSATNKVVYIPNGVNVTPFDSLSPPKYSRPTILFVGRDHPHKGIDTLRKAQHLVQAQHPQARFLYLTHTPPGRQLIRTYKRSHIFVLPSRAEGQPITLLEAWAARLPVIATTVGDNPYLIKPNHTGYLIPPNHPRLLARRILHLLQHPHQAQTMGQRGYKYVSVHHNWNRIAHQTHQLYTQITTAKS